MRFEYHVRTTQDYRETFTRKRDAMRAASALIALGKIVTIQQCRVYYRAED